MPKEVILSLAKKSNTSESNVEELYQKAKEIVSKNYNLTEEDEGFYALVIGVLKKSLGITDSVLICDHCLNDAGSGSYCDHCGSLFDGELLQIKLTQKDIDAIYAFLNVAMQSKVVMTDLMRFIRNTARAHGADMGDSFLFDVGDGSASVFKFKKSKEDGVLTVYSFSSDNFDYVVKLRLLNRWLEVDFNTEEDDTEYKVKNKGELFKVMATVVATVKDYLDEHPETLGLRYNPISKAGDDGKSRDKLYRAFIKKQLGDVDILQQGGTVFVKLKK